jgi:hypothetical protein
MANWDQLTVRCKDDLWMTGLIHGFIEGLWFKDMVEPSPVNEDEVFCFIKNGIDWPGVFKRESERHGIIIYCSIAFEHDRWMNKYYSRFENGVHTITRFDASYSLDTHAIPRVLRDDECAEIEARAINWARGVDLMSDQEQTMVERQGEYEVVYSRLETAVPFFFTFNDGTNADLKIFKNGTHVSVYCV